MTYLSVITIDTMEKKGEDGDEWLAYALLFFPPVLMLGSMFIHQTSRIFSEYWIEREYM